MTESERRPAPFGSVVVGLRWTTLAIGFALSTGRGPDLRVAMAWGLALLAYDLWRTVHRLDRRPVDDEAAGRPMARSPYLADLVIACFAVVGTGAWDSPFAFCLMVGLVAAGFAHGIGFSVGLALAASAVVTLADLVVGWGTNGYSLLPAGQWITELILVAVLAGYGRRVFGEAERRHSAALNRVSQLAEANSLLVSLHRVAQTLPASLDLEQVLESTITRIRSVIASDVIAVLVRDDPAANWAVLAAHGTISGRSFADGELPAPLATATTSSVASLVVCLSPGEGIGPALLSNSGLYAPLRANGRLVALVAVEHHEPGFYGRRDLQLLDGLVEPTALAIDNARWFARLRAIGADEERVRIARDMHDGIGQSLASLGFAIDRVRNQVSDEAVRGQLEGLRAMVRETLGEVRDTLADLRTDVSDDRGLAETLRTFVDRVSERSEMTVAVTTTETGRLPLVQEREMWRVAQEALTNVERHSQATHLSVRWMCDGQRARLTVADDGRGFAPATAQTSRSFGITGMRERADGIGAQLEIDTAPGSGTMVRCSLGGPTRPA